MIHVDKYLSFVLICSFSMTSCSELFPEFFISSAISFSCKNTRHSKFHSVNNLFNTSTFYKKYDAKWCPNSICYVSLTSLCYIKNFFWQMQCTQGRRTLYNFYQLDCSAWRSQGAKSWVYGGLVKAQNPVVDNPLSLRSPRCMLSEHSTHKIFTRFHVTS